MTMFVIGIRFVWRPLGLQQEEVVEGALARHMKLRFVAVEDAELDGVPGGTLLALRSYRSAGACAIGAGSELPSEGGHIYGRDGSTATCCDGRGFPVSACNERTIISAVGVNAKSCFGRRTRKLRETAQRAPAEFWPSQ